MTSPTDPRVPIPSDATLLTSQGTAGDEYVTPSIAPADLAHLYVAELPARGWIFDSPTSHLSGTDPGMIGSYDISVCTGGSWSAVTIGPRTDGGPGSEFWLLVDYYDSEPCPGA
jgi:hypothetical protein